MEHLREIKPIRGEQIWATIGVFDGVHLGHQKIINAMVSEAKKQNITTAVITFFPHPAVVLRKIPMPFYLSHPEEKAAFFQKLGVDATFTLNFTEHMAALPYRDFIQMITDTISVKQIWVGNDFALGRGRAGNTKALKELGVALGYQLVEFPHLMGTDHKISSSQIRAWIQAGEINKANQALGRPYSINGSVVHGDSRGRTLGFPTANLTIWPEKILPPQGVYATLAKIDQNVYKAVTNIGFRPTFENQKSETRIETFIIGFSETIYQKPMQLSFIERLRPEMRFNHIHELINQIQQDVKNAEEILKNVPQTPGLFT